MSARCPDCGGRLRVEKSKYKPAENYQEQRVECVDCHNRYLCRTVIVSRLKRKGVYMDRSP